MINLGNTSMQTISDENALLMTRHEKRSFLKLPVSIDINALLSDYRSIPFEAWKPSYWRGVHCSINLLLLRGGQGGNSYDFTAHDVADSSILTTLPYISWLVSDAGPFGGAKYAFIFRMKPRGVARPHVDGEQEWTDTIRIHVPIETNDGAFLLSERRAKHLRVGEAWTFDNQSLHAALNGDRVRTHLILDVPPNPTLSGLLEAADWDPGIEDPARWEQTLAPQEEASPVFVPATFMPLSPPEKSYLRLNPEGFASRISKPRWIARLRGCPLREGDVIYSVNKVEECSMALDAMGYILLCHKPGETVELGLIRGQRRLKQNLKLYSSPAPRLLSMWSRILTMFQGSVSPYQ